MGSCGAGFRQRRVLRKKKMRKILILLAITSGIVACYDEFRSRASVINATDQRLTLNIETQDDRTLSFEIAAKTRVCLTAARKNETVAPRRIEAFRAVNDKVGEFVVPKSANRGSTAEHIAVVIFNEGVYLLPEKIGREYKPRTHGEDFVAYVSSRKADILKPTSEDRSIESTVSPGSEPHKARSE
jgi:hypothetical protein